MTDADVPPGWGHNPSKWSHRLPVLLLALAGCGIATYLTLYQVGVLPTVWEPFFGIGSTVILKQSAIAHLLPVPDAALGAFVYLLEALAELIGGESRWRTKPWAVVLLGLIAAGLGVAAIVLVICQPALFGHFCTLCLASAACSLLGSAAAAPEVWATLQHLRREHERGVSWRHALRGTSPAIRPQPVG
jgi:uncharacterized membrane protein